jgi:hypothetical protein
VAEPKRFPIDPTFDDVPQIMCAVGEWLVEPPVGFREYRVEVDGIPEPQVRLYLRRKFIDGPIMLAIPASLEGEGWERTFQYIKSKWREFEVKSR